MRPTVGVMSDQEAARGALREFLTTRRERITPATPGCPRSVGAAASKGCAARRSRCWPGSARSTTSAWNVVPRRESHRRSSTPWQPHSGWTGTSGCTWIDSSPPSLPAARRKRRPTKPDTVSPGVQVMLDALQRPARRRLQRPSGHRRDQRSGPRALLLALHRARSSPTPPASCSSTRTGPAGSGPNGTSSPTTSWRSCGCRPGSTRRTRALVELVGQLSTRSEEFRTRWAANNVRAHRAAVKRVQPPGDRSGCPARRNHDHHRPRGPHLHGVHPTTRHP